MARYHGHDCFFRNEFAAIQSTEQQDRIGVKEKNTDTADIFYFLQLEIAS